MNQTNNLPLVYFETRQYKREKTIEERQYKTTQFILGQLDI